MDSLTTASFRWEEDLLNSSRQKLPTLTEVGQCICNENYGAVTLPRLGLCVKWRRRHLVSMPYLFLAQYTGWLIIERNPLWSSASNLDPRPYHRSVR
jgi:hypothetical protein